MRLIAATGASVQLGATARNPIDPDAANRALQAALQLAAALPYEPSDQIAATTFRSLAS